MKNNSIIICILKLICEEKQMSNNEYNISGEFKYNNIKNETINTYIQNRLIAQIKWYDKKSLKLQKKYKQLSIIAIIVTAIIPILTLLLDFECINLMARILIAILSSSATVVSSINSLYKNKELWIQYRSNCEILKSVLHRFYTKSLEFSNKSENEAFEILVSNCEKYLTQEFDSWNNIYSYNDQSSTNS